MRCVAVIAAGVLFSVLSAHPVIAQAARARMIVTVVDPSGAVIPDATVTLVAVDEATKAVVIAPVKTTDKGVATLDNVAPGRYAIQAAFPGFELGLLRDVRCEAATTSTSSCCRSGKWKAKSRSAATRRTCRPIGAARSAPR
jgi:hypothetical protein